jgi:SPP1 gp7 family putative phage head morphogenesis protein
MPDNVIKITTLSTLRTHEKRYAALTKGMVSDIFKIMISEINNITKKNEAKFKDINFAADFYNKAKLAERKALNKYNDKDLKKEIDSIHAGADKVAKTSIYSQYAKSLGLNSASLIKSDRLSVYRNALTLESSLWVNTLRNDTLKSIINNTVRLMAQGIGVAEIVRQARARAIPQGAKADFVARNQLSTFNGLMNKARAGKLGIERAEWVVNTDGRERESHANAHGKVFNIKKGLLVDGSYIVPGVDFNCRCRMRMIIDE